MINYKIVFHSFAASNKIVHADQNMILDGRNDGQTDRLRQSSFSASNKFVREDQNMIIDGRNDGRRDGRRDGRTDGRNDGMTERRKKERV